jgi:CRP-like cAMP-binding protein
MPFDWFTKPASSKTVAQLVVDKEYKKALDLLRAEFDKGNRSLDLRLQYADVLATSGQGDKAVPILLGLASELDAAGTHEQAAELLRQAERIEPGRADVAARRRAFVVRASRREKTGDTKKPDKKRSEKPKAKPAPVESVPEPLAAVVTPSAAENDAVLLFGPALAPPDLSLPLEARVDETEIEIPGEHPVGATPAPSPAVLAAALARAEATVSSDEWLEVEGEAPPEVLWAETSSHPSIADIAEMAVNEGQGSKDDLLLYVQELVSRFPASGDERPAASELAGALLGGLPEGDLRALLPGLGRHDFDPGHAMVSEGARGRGVFILARGRARVLVQGEHSRPFEVAEIGEGSFFGEISLLDRPRSATVLAVGPCEVLMIAPETLEALAEQRPRVRKIVEETLLERTNSPEAAAVRAIPPMDEAIPAQAVRLLETHFGPKVKDPKMRLRLADLLARSGNYVDVVPVLVGLAEEMQAAGQLARALAILKKIETIHHQGPKEVGIAPLTRALPQQPREGPGSAVVTYVTTGGPAPSAKAAAHFRRWLQELMAQAREAIGPSAESSLLGPETEGPAGRLEFDRPAAKGKVEGEAQA